MRVFEIDLYSKVESETNLVTCFVKVERNNPNIQELSEVVLKKLVGVEAIISVTNKDVTFNDVFDCSVMDDNYQGYKAGYLGIKELSTADVSRVLEREYCVPVKEALKHLLQLTEPMKGGGEGVVLESLTDF